MGTRGDSSIKTSSTPRLLGKLPGVWNAFELDLRFGGAGSHGCGRGNTDEQSSGQFAQSTGGGQKFMGVQCTSHPRGKLARSFIRASFHPSICLHLISPFDVFTSKPHTSQPLSIRYSILKTNTSPS